jgi:hypothetical protein
VWELAGWAGKPHRLAEASFNFSFRALENPGNALNYETWNSGRKPLLLFLPYFYIFVEKRRRQLFTPKEAN